MQEWALKQFCKIPIVGDWLTNWRVQRELEHLKKHYLALIQQVEGDNIQQQAELTAEWAVKRESVLDPVYARNSANLIERALKYGITVPPQDPDSKHYRKSGVTGEFILRQATHRRLRREVRNEERARNDEFRKWATVVFALLAFGLGLASLIVKTKQPDPCPRNYYRTDAGSCVFALPPEGRTPVANKSVPAEIPNRKKPPH